MNFRVGQKVVCVMVDGIDGDWSDDAPVLGDIYTIQRMLIDEDGDLIFHFYEIARDQISIDVHGPDVGYWSARFRPVVERKTDISIFASMLNPSQVNA